MNGAESLVHTLLGCGVDTCFANPGTSEMHFVAALDRIPGMRCVLGLFEGVVTGAADGYARMADKPAATLMHCGPGLANGLANLHNAQRARSAVVNIVGDQATYHRPLDPPLVADTEGWARPVSGWTRTATCAATVGQYAAAAVQAANIPPGQIATLILPSDTSWDEGGVVGQKLPCIPAPLPPKTRIEQVARVLRRGEPAVILLGGVALRAASLEVAQRIAAFSGARLIAERTNTRIERGRGRVPISRMFYAVDRALADLAGTKHLILVGSKTPVSFFAYPGKPSYMQPPDCEVHVLARPEENLLAALTMLAEELNAPAIPSPAVTAPPDVPKGEISAQSVAQALAALLPENAIVTDESITLGLSLYVGTQNAAPHDWIQLTGGAIGEGLPLSTGAAIGAPGRRVISLEGDGSAMYTVQALWTQARELLDVTTVILSNRKYAILLGELAQVKANPGRTAHNMLDLADPELNWPEIAKGMGVEGARAETLKDFTDLFKSANSRKGPFLIELVI